MTAVNPQATSPHQWFRVQAGPNEGKLRISGWIEFAIPGNGGAWVQFGVCPLCRAVVYDTWGNLAGHEKWHSEVDFPVPDELRLHCGLPLTEVGQCRHRPHHDLPKGGYDR